VAAINRVRYIFSNNKKLAAHITEIVNDVICRMDTSKAIFVWISSKYLRHLLRKVEMVDLLKANS